MIGADEVKKLAELSRIALTDEEVEKMRSEIEEILAYADIVRKVELPEGAAWSPHLQIENVMRDDAHAGEPGAFTEALLAQAPRKEGGYLKVRKIFS